MARYTELFSEYLENGGQLPAIFDDITGFKDHFIRYYCDKEIGFETETLFRIKLEEAGALFIPIYKPRLDNYNVLIASVGQVKTTATRSKMGEINGTSTELPFDDAGAVAPAAKTHTDEVINETNVKEELTDDERRRAVDFLERQAKAVMKQLLDAFAPCFMCIF